MQIAILLKKKEAEFFLADHFLFLFQSHRSDKVIDNQLSKRETYNESANGTKVVNKGRPEDVDGNEITGYDCPYCTDRFATAQALNSHLDSHIEVRFLIKYENTCSVYSFE